VGAVSDQLLLVDLERIRLDDVQLFPKVLPKLIERRDTPSVALNCENGCAGIEQGACEAARTRPDFVDAFTFQLSGDSSDARKQLAVEDEICPSALLALSP